MDGSTKARDRRRRKRKHWLREVIGLLPSVKRYIYIYRHGSGYLPDRASVARFGESLPWRALLYIMASIVHGCSGILRSRYIE